MFELGNYICILPCLLYRTRIIPVQVDYSDINELIEDEEGVDETSSSSYPMDPPPVPETSQAVIGQSNEKLKHIVTPLADMLPPEFKGKDVREFFPDFRLGEVRLTLYMYFIHSASKWANFKAFSLLDIFGVFFA